MTSVTSTQYGIFADCAFSVAAFGSSVTSLPGNRGYSDGDSNPAFRVDLRKRWGVACNSRPIWPHRNDRTIPADFARKVATEAVLLIVGATRAPTAIFYIKPGRLVDQRNLARRSIERPTTCTQLGPQMVSSRPSRTCADCPLPCAMSTATDPVQQVGLLYQEQTCISDKATSNPRRRSSLPVAGRRQPSPKFAAPTAFKPTTGVRSFHDFTFHGTAG